MRYTVCFIALLLLLYIQEECNGIGRLCKNEKQCSDGQYCIWGKCLCLNGQILSNNRCVMDFYCQNGQEVYHDGQCYHLSAIGEKCLINEQCYGESFCINNSCTCLHETVNVNGICQKRNLRSIRQCKIHQISVHGECLDIVAIGEVCQIDAQCSDGANCFNQHCSCPPGTVQNEKICKASNCSRNEVLINGKCLSLIIPGQQCKHSVQCLDGSQCSSVTHICGCIEGMNNVGGYCRKLSYTDPCDSISMVYVNNSCVEITKPGDQCIYDLQCLSGSICTDGYCNCPQGTTNINGYCTGSVLCNQDEILLNNRCFKRVTLNELCFINEQCPNNAICNYAARCVCPVGMMAINGHCQPSQIIYCKDVEVLVNGRCIRRRVPGTSCLANEQCLDESLCINGYCRCTNDTELLSRYCIRRNKTKNCDTYQIYINDKCLDLAIPGEECINNMQCIAAASICHAGKCICSNGYIEVKKYCIRDHFRPSAKCPDNQILINGHCYEFAKIGQYCIDTAICLGNAICYNNYCICPNGTIAQNGRCENVKHCLRNEIQIDGQCYPKINIGQYCQFTKQCVSISTCQNSICTCPPGTVAQNNICISSGLCPTGQLLINENCWDIAYIGQQCQFTRQCQGYSKCVNNICQCANDTIIHDGLCFKEHCNSNEIKINGICFKLAKIGEFCYYTEQCEMNAICQADRCICPPGTINSNDTCIINSNCQPYQISINDSCLDTVSIGMTCQDNSQCIESSNCMIGGGSLNNLNIRTCQCNNGTIFTGSECLPSTIKCPLSTVYTFNNVCYALVEIGQFCLFTIQCMGYSICSRQICKCPIGYQNIRNACRKN
ncbi:EB module family protein [Brugia pahangi]